VLGSAAIVAPGLITVGVPHVAEAYAPSLGSRAMGTTSRPWWRAGLVGRVGVALLTAATDWRVALGLVTLLPLASTLLMRRGLPPEPPAERAGSRPPRLARGRARRARELSPRARVRAVGVAGGRRARVGRAVGAVAVAGAMMRAGHAGRTSTAAVRGAGSAGP
jgi:hypothetical protein